MTDPRAHLLQNLTRNESRALAPDALLVLPLGATEQHGPHLPLATDLMLVEHVGRAAAELAAESAPMVVAPTLPFGSSHHHLPFGGTISLATRSYLDALADAVSSLIESGYRRVFLLNGHGGNQELALLVARDTALAQRANVAAASYWDIGRSALAALEPTASLIPGHAGIFETSLMAAVRPELVRSAPTARDHDSDLSSSRSSFRSEVHGAWQVIAGYTDRPAEASAERGRAYLGAIVPAVAAAFIEFHAMPVAGESPAVVKL